MVELVVVVVVAAAVAVVVVVLVVVVVHVCRCHYLPVFCVRILETFEYLR